MNSASFIEDIKLKRGQSVEGMTDNLESPPGRNPTERDKILSALICSYISKILLEIWDPIGIKFINEAQDEYESYVETIYLMLAKNCTHTELENYFFWIEREHMGIEGDIEKTKRVVCLIMDLIK